VTIKTIIELQAKPGERDELVKMMDRSSRWAASSRTRASGMGRK
jgi:hypothetical protein